MHKSTDTTYTQNSTIVGVVVENKTLAPQTFCLCIQQELKYMLYWNNVCDQHGGQWWLVGKQQNMEEVD